MKENGGLKGKAHNTFKQIRGVELVLILSLPQKLDRKHHFFHIAVSQRPVVRQPLLYPIRVRQQELVEGVGFGLEITEGYFLAVRVLGALLHCQLVLSELAVVVQAHADLLQQFLYQVKR